MEPVTALLDTVVLIALFGPVPTSAQVADLARISSASATQAMLDLIAHFLDAKMVALVMVIATTAPAFVTKAGMEKAVH